MSADGPTRGRGSASQMASRFVAWERTAEADGWTDDPPETVRTRVDADQARSVITYNQSPDVPFDRSINPYRGCEHGCAYCFARPTHAWLGLSPGIDFETRLSAKFDAADRLSQELDNPGYSCAPIALGVNTDAYQPVERSLCITRGILQVLLAHQHPVVIITKGSLIERDIDVLRPLADARLLSVVVSVTTLDAPLSRALEPRAASPGRRLQVIERLSTAGIPVGVLMAPLIPGLTDHEIEGVIANVAGAGARSVRYACLRLPREVAPLFKQWLHHHRPARADRVMSLVHQLRGGADYDARFGFRMQGQGPLADLYRQRFALALKRHGLQDEPCALDTTQFHRSAGPGSQLELL